MARICVNSEMEMKPTQPHLHEIWAAGDYEHVCCFATRTRSKNHKKHMHNCIVVVLIIFLLF